MWENTSIVVAAVVCLLIIWFALKAIKLIWKVIFFIFLAVIFYYSYPYVKEFVDNIFSRFTQ